MKIEDRPVFSLIGPTATGKTELALEIAERFNVALISVDSAMVYRGLNVGTSKPSPKSLQQYPHALVDIVEPETAFSVSDFVSGADDAVNQSFENGCIPLLVGGSMLYFKAFREGIAQLPSRDLEFRAELKRRRSEVGTAALYEKLQKIDPQACSQIHPNNYSRIERALEVHAITGRSMTSLLTEHPGVPVDSRLNCTHRSLFLLHHDREEIHQRIETRFHQMLNNGFVKEVQELMNRPGLERNSVSMKAAGYQQLWDRLIGHPNEPIDEETKHSVVAVTRQLARRQLTWMRSWSDLPNLTEIKSQNPLKQVMQILEQTTFQSLS